MNTVNVKVNFSEIDSFIKPMHSVNNGPMGNRAHSSGDSNAYLYTEAAIPFARNHDANFFYQYGAPHTVDIMAIFPNFDADENDPESYDFHLTDEYNRSIVASGTKIFYRLGNKIEHESKKYGANPPKDFNKFARICEHIIRHMNEGWANGTYLNIEYWEIWNEADIGAPCWTGTKEQFYELYDITSRHLKSCFPNLKIGGPAVAVVSGYSFVNGFFEYITRNKEDKAPLDFFSFHMYSTTPEAIASQVNIAKEYLQRFGYENTETILNEWNYVRNWAPSSEMLYIKKVIPSLKGSAFVLSTMLACQKTELDHLMYYDASIGAMWNGLFDRDTYGPLKPYYGLYAFSRLYSLKNEVKSECDTEKVYTGAAISDDGNEACIVITRYEDLNDIDEKNLTDITYDLRVDWNGFTAENGVKVTYSLLDSEHNLEPVSEEIFFGSKGAHILKLPMYTTVLVSLTKL
ncbi:MAG: hypothetical protein J6M16_01895 [Clostridia bacterium]|nr:hypothetical protein [Clostridia bacterium]